MNDFFYPSKIEGNCSRICRFVQWNPFDDCISLFACKTYRKSWSSSWILMVDCKTSWLTYKLEYLMVRRFWCKVFKWTLCFSVAVVFGPFGVVFWDVCRPNLLTKYWYSMIIFSWRSRQVLDTCVASCSKGFIKTSFQWSRRNTKPSIPRKWYPFSIPLYLFKYFCP